VAGGLSLYVVISRNTQPVTTRDYADNRHRGYRRHRSRFGERLVGRPDAAQLIVATLGTNALPSA
jgi:hypothetical protein